MKPFIYWCVGAPNDIGKILFPLIEKEIGEQVYIDDFELPYEEGGVVIVMGTFMLNLLKKAGIAPKTPGVNKLRSQRLIHGSCSYFVTFDPQAAAYDASIPDQIRWDVSVARRWVETGSMEPDVGEYRYVDDLTDVCHYIEANWLDGGEPLDIAVDSETMGLLPWYPDKKIVAFQVSVEHGKADVVHLLRDWTEEGWNKFLSQVAWLLTTKKVKIRGANFKYDLMWFWEKWGLECTNFTFDTTIVGSLLDENRSNSLSLHAKLLTSMGGYDDEFNRQWDKGHMELVPRENLLPYAGGDPDACRRSAGVMKQQLLSDAPLTTFYVKLLHPAARAFEKVEREGILVDLDKYGLLRRDVDRALISMTDEMMSMVPSRLRGKYSDDLKVSRPALIVDLMFSNMGFGLKPRVFTPKTGAISTSLKDHLSMFKDHPEAGRFVTLLEDHGKLNKLKQTYIDGFLMHKRPDGRFHPTYMLFKGGVYNDPDDTSGTVTGRTSAKDPAIQTLMKRGAWAKRLRDCYPAPVGYKVFALDFSQGELRLVADASGDATMLNAYLNDQDLHAITAAKLSGMELGELLHMMDTAYDEYDVIRYRGKAGNFGLVYGMSADGYQEYARAVYGLELTLAEAVDHREAYFGLYPGLIPWQDGQREYVKDRGFVRSPLGRVRRLPLVWSPDSFWSSKAKRQAINAPIQSTLSDMCLWALALIVERYITKEMVLVAMIHDQLIGYVKEGLEMEWLGRLKAIMENLPFEETFGWKPRLSFPVDCELGPTLGTLEKVAV